MHILHISFHTSPFSNIGENDSGGLNIYIQELARTISKTDKVTVVTGESDKSFMSNNINFISYNLFNKTDSFKKKELSIKKFSKLLKDDSRLLDVDVIHAHYWLSGTVAKTINKEFGTPYIYTAHSYGSFLQNSDSRIRSEQEILTAAKFITASSNFEKRTLIKKYHTPQSKIKIITPGVNNKIFKYKEIKNRKKYILSIGRIQEQKGQLKILDFFKTLSISVSDLELIFIGGPSGAKGKQYLSLMKSKINQLGIQKSVKFFGSLDQKKIANLLNKSKLLIHSSEFETFGLVVIESNSMGVPVVSTNQGAVKELIENNVNGFVVKDFNDKNLYTFVSKTLNNATFFKKVSHGSIKSAKQFSWEKTSLELKKIYEETKLV